MSRIFAPAAGPVTLFVHVIEGESPVSRSQGKNVVSHAGPLCEELVLDFAGVKSIGPAFADEIFRVFQNTHPGVGVRVTNANGEVRRMIDRAIAARRAAST